MAPRELGFRRAPVKCGISRLFARAPRSLGNRPRVFPVAHRGAVELLPLQDSEDKTPCSGGNCACEPTLA